MSKTANENDHMWARVHPASPTVAVAAMQT
jgi:hypothetical protein